MSAVILDGKKMAQELENKQRARCEALKAAGVTPGLAVVLVGENPASMKYVASKERMCEAVGVVSFTRRLPESCTQQELEQVVDEMNADPRVHGVLVQLPLPAGLDETAILRRIRPDKDVDCFHPYNMGLLSAGIDGPKPGTPRGILYMLREAGVPMAGAHAVVVGRSNIVGKPVALMLLKENATVTICHSRTRSLADITRQADILVAAVGIPKFITADMVKPGAAVVDVGINRVDGKIVGDVDSEAVAQVAGCLTPVPGGVGKMTVAMLLENTLDMAAR